MWGARVGATATWSRSARAVAERVAEQYAALPSVEAVALGGSAASGVADEQSDIDLYVYSRSEIPISTRAAIARAAAARAEVDNRFWEPGDEWVDAVSGIAVDVIFRSVDWIEEQIDRVLRRHEASVGYSTCLWYNVHSSHILFDRTGWFRALQDAARQPYPEPLRQAIVAKNHPILARAQSSYRRQLQKAVERGDLVSVSHRVTVLLASYFDILFAVNRLAHPGEKRLLELAVARCTTRPPHMRQHVLSLLAAAAAPDARLLVRVDDLVAGLDRLLLAESLIDGR